MIFHVYLNETFASEFPKIKLVALNRHGLRIRRDHFARLSYDRGLAGATRERFVFIGCYETFEAPNVLVNLGRNFFRGVRCGLQWACRTRYQYCSRRSGCRRVKSLQD